MEIQVIKISDEEKVLVSDFYGEDLGNNIDFNRLMPVVEKIFKMDIVLKRKDKSAEIKKALIYNLSIESVYKAVVEFLKWYNEQKRV